MRVYLGLVLACVYFATVNGCKKQGDNPKVSVGVKKEPIEEPRPTIAETTTVKPLEEVSVCSEYCHYQYCVGGNPEEDGIQLSSNRTCENHCVWLNGTTPHDEPMITPGQCVMSRPTGDPYIDCQPCLKLRESIDFDLEEETEDYQSFISGNGRCCDTLEVDSNTNTELDQMIDGQYHYFQDYNGYPAFRKEADESDLMVPLYLFYHENRWVVEPILGAVTNSGGGELWGLLRWNGSYKCPENVGRHWTYYVEESGIVDESDSPIDVSCASWDPLD